MREIEFRTPQAFDPKKAKAILERAFDKVGLKVTLKTELAGYPGCTHWHLKRGREEGTLEVTMWPKTDRIWAKIQAGRVGDWINEVLPSLRRDVEDKLRKRRPR